jgi:adenosylmethionine-8-amino-7-oxononanoate aminotransferase
MDWNTLPDILCLGKAITNGYIPLSAALATEAIYERFHKKENFFAHGVTHGGHPVACAVSLAAIDIIINERLPEQAARVGEYLKSKLEKLMDHHAIIGEVRGRGLMLAIETVRDRVTKEPYPAKEVNDMGINMAMMGLVISTRWNHFRLTPPLITDEHLADDMVRIIDRGLEQGILAKLGNTGRKVAEFASAKLNP